MDLKKLKIKSKNKREKKQSEWKIYKWNFRYVPMCELTGGYIRALDVPIMDGTWPPTMELDGTSIVVDVCDMFDGPRFPYGLGDGAYVLP